MKPVNICLISLRSYPLFAKKSSEYFGGAEVQISLIAKELAKDNRFKVSVITGDYGQKKVISKKGLKIYKTNLIDFFKILRAVNADVYIERTANVKVGLVGWFCKVFNKKLIYMMAHDWDISNKWLYFFGLKNADLIITQTEDQWKKLKKNFKLNSVVIPSVIKIISSKKSEKREYVLWVGRADDWKKPITFLNLVQKFPKEKFAMICRQGKNEKLFKKVKKFAELQSNLKFFSAVPIEEITNFFAKAKLFVNTSTAEGFPNTFLQAGMTKTPVLSLKINPNKYINEYGCGLVAENNQKKMVKLCRKMLKNPKLLKTMGENHYNYVKKNHSLKNFNILKTAVWELLS